MIARSADISSLTGKIVWLGFWRAGPCFIEEDLVMEEEAENGGDASKGPQRMTQRYRADMFIDIGDGIKVEYGNSHRYRYELERQGIKLDDYLIPVFMWEGIEKEAEVIIFQIAPKGLEDSSRLQPGQFAERLGLEIVNLPLYRRDRTASILFLRRTKCWSIRIRSAHSFPLFPCAWRQTSSF